MHLEKTNILKLNESFIFFILFFFFFFHAMPYLAEQQSPLASLRGGLSYFVE